MTTIPGYYTRTEAAALLGVSLARVAKIAVRDSWDTITIGRSYIHSREDVERTARKMAAQQAWAALSIPRNLWGAWWLADPDEITLFPCPSCSATAYSPAGDDPKYSHLAACPSCGWTT